MVLYELASFIRNILVCKDPASAGLLESIEGWRDQYISTAKEISTPYLVSALNILNEAEIGFKSARNKRLHVEMSLIKLNFLQQAIELSMEDNQVVKKKLIDAQYPIRLKKIIPLSNIVVNAEAKLVIETEAPVTKKETPIISKEVPHSLKQSTSQNEPSPSTPTIPSNVLRNTIAETEKGGPKKSLLAVLQQKYGQDYKIEEVKESKPLEMELLKKCWDEYALHLESNAKHASSGTFKVAQLNIIDEVHFTVTVGALTAQKFVEQERMSFLEIVWNAFENRAIQFSVLVEAGEKEDVPLHMRLNSKQKYDRIAEQFPLVNELKRRCNLEVYF